MASTSSRASVWEVDSEGQANRLRYTGMLEDYPASLPQPDEDGFRISMVRDCTYPYCCFLRFVIANRPKPHGNWAAGERDWLTWGEAIAEEATMGDDSEPFEHDEEGEDQDTRGSTNNQARSRTARDAPALKIVYPGGIALTTIKILT